MGDNVPFAVFGAFQEELEENLFVPFELSDQRTDGEYCHAQVRAEQIDRQLRFWSVWYNTGFRERREIDLCQFWKAYVYYARLANGEFNLGVDEYNRNEVVYDLELLGVLCKAIGKRAEKVAKRVRGFPWKPRPLRSQYRFYIPTIEYPEQEVEDTYRDIRRLFSNIAEIEYPPVEVESSYQYVRRLFADEV